jgi:hypothetical protein
MYSFFNQHFELGLNAKELVEQDYVPLTPGEATVWAGNYAAARPVLSEAAEVTLLRALDASSSAAINDACSAAGVRAGRMQEVVGGWLRVAVGRGAAGSAEELAALEPLMAKVMATAQAAETGTAAVALPVYIDEPNRPVASTKPRGFAQCQLHSPPGGQPLEQVIVVVSDGNEARQHELVEAILATTCLCFRTACTMHSPRSPLHMPSAVAQLTSSWSVLGTRQERSLLQPQPSASLPQPRRR